MKKLIAALTIGAVALMTSPAFASPGGHEGFRGERGFSGGHPGGHFEGQHGFQGHRDFDRGGHGRAFIGVPPSFYWWYHPPVYAYVPAPQSYWYYCPSARAYYPYVSSCPEAWVPVPASVQ